MRRLIPILLLILAATTSAQQAEIQMPAPPPETTLYMPDGRQAYFHTFKGNNYLVDLSIGKIALSGNSRPRTLVLSSGIHLKVFQHGLLKYKLSSHQAISQYPYQTFDFQGITTFDYNDSYIEIEAMHFDIRQKAPYSTTKFIEIGSNNQIIQGEGGTFSLDLERWDIVKVVDVLALEE
ncbi:MAG TPA: hypothetical protein ENJ82_02270 [Bacteroidetes bacterium]|nr:hypothetical protein [Bacteroidota bacterium]